MRPENSYKLMEMTVKVLKVRHIILLIVLLLLNRVQSFAHISLNYSHMNFQNKELTLSLLLLELAQATSSPLVINLFISTAY